MKLVGKLKEKVSKAENKEQAKEMIADAGMELTDDELDKVNGGTYDSLIQDALDQGKEKECIRDCNGSTLSDNTPQGFTYPTNPYESNRGIINTPNGDIKINNDGKVEHVFSGL